MSYTIEEIAASLGAQALGDVSLRISRASEPAAASPVDLALATTPAYAADLDKGKARAAVLWPGADWQAFGLDAAIIAPRGRLAMARLTSMLKTDPGFEDGIHPTAFVHPDANVANDVSVGAFCYVGAGASIGAGSKLASHVSVGAAVSVGKDAQLYEGVILRSGTRIGDRFVAQPGSVVGGDGLSFTTEEPSNIELVKQNGGAEKLASPGAAPWHKIESLGGVEISDDVELGSNSTIDAGTIRATRIGRGTKIDNLVQIGHNVILGEDCMISAQAGVAGSCVIGNRVILGGQSGVADNLRIGDDVVAGGASVILSNVAAGTVVLGYPAQRMDKTLASYKTLRRLSRSKPVPKDEKNG